MSTSRREADVATAPEIYDHLDYREYLRAHVQWKRESSRSVSLRQIAGKIGVDHSLLTKILQSTRHLTPANVPGVCNWLKLDEARCTYFDEMLAYARARNDESVRRHFERLLELRPVEKRRLEAAHYEYFQSWHHVAVRSLLDWYEFYGADWTALGSMLVPAITGIQARESVELLQRLGLVIRDATGRFRPSSTHLSTGERWHSAAVRTFQRETIRLSEGAVDRIARERRDVSTLTIALASSCLDEIREVLKEARARIVKIADRLPSEESDAVYQLNMQWFPVTVDPSAIPATPPSLPPSGPEEPGPDESGTP